MSLKSRLNEDMKTAMRNKDHVLLSTIRLANAAVKQFEIDERCEADDAKITAILSKMIKQRKDSAKIYTDAGRRDLAEKEEAEITVLNRYLPEMLSSEAIDAEVAAAIAKTGAAGMADMGKVMGVLKSKLSGKADMGEVNKAVKAALDT
ncbi:MAG: GatB/YqeY domain-containing protein [Neisseria sp.]|nr:GatB/YqeY domain-containing protein [Neisseria sp.]